MPSPQKADKNADKKADKKADDKDLTISSWNVNGLRACFGKGFLPWLNSSGGHVVGLQEVRAFANQLPLELQEPQDWNPYYTAGVRPGYSGVGLLCRNKPDEVGSGLGIAEFDVEGRFQWLRFGKLVVANGYFPKGSGKDRDNSRVPYKLKFYEAVFRFIEDLRKAGMRVLVMGDFNTAHTEIDLARPASNHGTSGFLPEERAAFSRWCKAGWVDTFRTLHPEPGHYSWWSQRLGARARNVGWRIDYVLACPEAMRFVKKAFISPTVQGSDHCPVGVVVDGSITG